MKMPIESKTDNMFVFTQEHLEMLSKIADDCSKASDSIPELDDGTVISEKILTVLNLLDQVTEAVEELESCFDDD